MACETSLSRQAVDVEVFRCSGDPLNLQTSVLLVCTSVRHYIVASWRRRNTLPGSVWSGAPGQCSVAAVLHLPAEFFDAMLLTSTENAHAHAAIGLKHQGCSSKLPLFGRCVQQDDMNLMS